jgi:hypothetical protein
MSLALFLYTELAQDRVAKSLTDVLCGVPRKRCLSSVQVDLGVPLAFFESCAQVAELAPKLAELHLLSLVAKRLVWLGRAKGMRPPSDPTRDAQGIINKNVDASNAR